MSRGGRAAELLDDWRAHDPECAVVDGWGEDHGAAHGLDAHDVLELLDGIDPFFRQAKREHGVRVRFPGAPTLEYVVDSLERASATVDRINRDSSQASADVITRTVSSWAVVVDDEPAEPEPAAAAEPEHPLCLECGHAASHRVRRGECVVCGCDGPRYAK